MKLFISEIIEREMLLTEFPPQAQSTILRMIYHDANEATREALDHAFLILCSRTLSGMLELAREKPE